MKMAGKTGDGRYQKRKISAKQKLWILLILTPGIGIFVTVVLFNLLGDAVRDCMDHATREERGIL